MLKDIVDSGSPVVGELWSSLENCSDAFDRILLRNLTSDLRLNDAQFSREVESARFDILEFFSRWYEEYHKLTPKMRTFLKAYEQVVNRDREIPDSTAAWAYRRLFLLGFDTAKLNDALYGVWVSFVKYRPPRRQSISVDNRDVTDSYRVNSSDVTESIKSTCRFKRMIWIACHETIKDDISMCEAVEHGHRKFDALRNRLGLGWSCDGIPIVALSMSLAKEVALARVPTFFDACGYPFFRPVHKEWFQQHGCGCTCPIDRPDAPGIAELVVWVGDDDLPGHTTKASGLKRHDWRVLEDQNKEPLIFIVKTDFDLGLYAVRRT